MFNRLFNSKPDAKADGLTQPQREAIVDLLHYCMYGDNLVTMSETRFIEAKVKAYSWDPKISFEYYQGKSIGAARAALANAEGKKKFFESVNQRLGTAAMRAEAFELCDRLFKADGAKPAGEFAMQGEIRTALGIG